MHILVACIMWMHRFVAYLACNVFRFHFCVNAFRFSCKCLRIILHISIACIVGLSMTVFGGLYVLVNAYFFFVFFFFSPKNAYIFYSIMCPDILNHNPSTQHFERLVLAMVFLISWTGRMHYSIGIVIKMERQSSLILFGSITNIGKQVQGSSKIMGNVIIYKIWALYRE